MSSSNFEGPSSSSSSLFNERLSTQDSLHLDQTTEPWFPGTEADWDMMMNCTFDFPFDPLSFWDPSLTTNPCYPPPSSVHLELEPQCTYETPIASSTDSIHAIRDSLNEVLTDLGDLQSDYQAKIKQMARFVVLVGFRYALLTNKGRSKRPTKRLRFCARTSTQQRSPLFGVGVSYAGRTRAAE
jgi:hypothetical protein